MRRGWWGHACPNGPSSNHAKEEEGDLGERERDDCITPRARRYLVDPRDLIGQPFPYGSRYDFHDKK